MEPIKLNSLHLTILYLIVPDLIQPVKANIDYNIITGEERILLILSLINIGLINASHNNAPFNTAIDLGVGLPLLIENYYNETKTFSEKS